ncbi:LIRB5 protein, partial [Psilopogon haemacephalus]|nr:LIRB5 protein [Psilopogon haemacephalus]
GAPPISIFLKPPGVMAPGGSATICCSWQGGRGQLELHKDGQRLRAPGQGGGSAEFTISNASFGDRGTYRCHGLAAGTLLARSEDLDVMVQELLLPAPALSVLPAAEVPAGSGVSLRCSSALPAARCWLYLEGRNAVLDVLSQHQETFNISHAREGDGGRYSCQCFQRAEASFRYSAASRPLELVVR